LKPNEGERNAGKLDMTVEGRGEIKKLCQLFLYAYDGKSVDF
jgi:hypothetical protein